MSRVLETSSYGGAVLAPSSFGCAVSDGLRPIAARDQLKPNVCGTGRRTDVVGSSCVGWLVLAAGVDGRGVVRGISGLAAVWRGPSAAAMTTAATRYQSWLPATAAQAETTAAQARTAAAAFEAAFAATVPPELVAVNRSRLCADDLEHVGGSAQFLRRPASDTVGRESAPPTSAASQRR